VVVEFHNAKLPPEAQMLVLQEGKFLFHQTAPGVPLRGELLSVQLRPSGSPVTCVGEFAGDSCYAMEYPVKLELNLNDIGLAWYSLRELLGTISEKSFQFLGRAAQLLRWDREHKFCGSCGSLTKVSSKELVRECHTCELQHYPKLAPCVICLVRRGEQLLLARHARSKLPFFSILAGFVEPGENLEEAVKREIREEVNIEINDIQYHGSQPWPFPGQLMVGFTAQYASGNLQVDGEEILEASWFDCNDLPLIPPVSTISGQLIEKHLNLFRN